MVAVRESPSFVGLGLGGAKTSNSGATDKPSKLGEPVIVSRCARPLKGELCAVNPFAEAAEEAGPEEADDAPTEDSLADPKILDAVYNDNFCSQYSLVEEDEGCTYRSVPFRRQRLW